MRVLLLSREHPSNPESGGIGSYVACIADALAARGDEVHVLSCLPGHPTEDVSEGTLHLHRRSTLPIRGLGRLLRSPGAAGRITQAVSAMWHASRLGLRPDVIEAPDYMAEGLLAGRMPARRAPVVAHIHTPSVLLRRFSNSSTDGRDRLSDDLERWAVERAAAITAPSQLAVELLEEAGWHIRDRVRVIPQPIDAERWARVGPAGDTPRRVLFVGRLDHLKGAEVLVEAAALLTREVDDVEVVFVGRSGQCPGGMPYRRFLEELSFDRGAPCRFLGPVAREDLPRLYRSARVVAVPSRYDNFPMVAVEAMAAARPVVCTTNVGLAGLVRRVDPSAVVPVADAAALAEALRPYLERSTFASDVGCRAREVVLETCAPDVVAARRESLYRELIA